jgi:hypothetical protein
MSAVSSNSDGWGAFCISITEQADTPIGLKWGEWNVLQLRFPKKNDSLVLLTFLLIWPVTSSFDSPIGLPSLRLLHCYFLLDRRWSRSFTYVKILVNNNSFNLVLYFWPDRGKEWKML